MVVRIFCLTREHFLNQLLGTVLSLQYDTSENTPVRCSRDLWLSLNKVLNFSKTLYIHHVGISN